MSTRVLAVGSTSAPELHSRCNRPNRGVRRLSLSRRASHRQDETKHHVRRRNSPILSGLTSLGTSDNIHQNPATMRRGMTFLTDAHRPTSP
jgi:hypothetical protein